MPELNSDWLTVCKASAFTPHCIISLAPAFLKEILEEIKGNNLSISPDLGVKLHKYTENSIFSLYTLVHNYFVILGGQSLV